MVSPASWTISGPPRPAAIWCFPRQRPNARYRPPAGARICPGSLTMTSVICSRRAVCKAAWTFPQWPAGLDTRTAGLSWAKLIFTWWMSIREKWPLAFRSENKKAAAGKSLDLPTAAQHEWRRKLNRAQRRVEERAAVCVLLELRELLRGDLFSHVKRNQRADGDAGDDDREDGPMHFHRPPPALRALPPRPPKRVLMPSRPATFDRLTANPARGRDRFAE